MTQPDLQIENAPAASLAESEDWLAREGHGDARDILKKAANHDFQGREFLQQSERQYREVIDALPAAVYTTDLAGRLTFYNEAAAVLWGVQPQLGTDRWCGSWRLYRPDGSPMPHEECPMAVALKEGRTVRGEEAVAERPDGTRVPFLAFPTPLFDAAGKMVGAVNMLVDLTDRKTDAEALRISDERLRFTVQEVEGLNTRLQRAMAETHHRVKNNLQVISAMIDMMLMRDEPAVPSDQVRSLGSHIRALAVIHDILTREAKKDGHADAVSVRDFLLPIISALEKFSGGHEIKAEVEDLRLPVRAATSLALITNELVQNAIKYGRREVMVSFSAKGNGGRLCVRDDGPGFPAGFDPSAQDTTGIELVQRLSRWDLAGTIEFRNAPSGGAVVTLDIPLQPASPAK